MDGYAINYSVDVGVGYISPIRRVFSHVIQQASGITLRCVHLFTLGRLLGYTSRKHCTHELGSLPRRLVHLNTSSHGRGFSDHPRCSQSTVGRLYDLRMSCSWWDARDSRDVHDAGIEAYRGILNDGFYEHLYSTWRQRIKLNKYNSNSKNSNTSISNKHNVVVKPKYRETTHCTQRHYKTNSSSHSVARKNKPLKVMVIILSNTDRFLKTFSLALHS